MAGYLTLMLGAGVALSEIGMLRRVPSIGIGIVAAVAIGIGMMLSVSLDKPTVEEIKS